MATKTEKYEAAKDQRIVEKPEIAMIEASICKKLNTIVNLVHEFSTDALGLRESADDLLDELRKAGSPMVILCPYLLTCTFVDL
ncbi:hypothetical protein OESDEN_19880 [Oesophagostomum dentatum]|uniref:Uncharacterized protein n=1 Tax=Oesophagostomum dentatum TaxID=61180 RepID=A0A0B1SB30_OESDE|nr:hypothetical protein OESDEN_19880 [Oesophagostomum dentatum]